MSEAVTVPGLTMMTSTVSKESLARDTHAHIHTQTRVSSKLKFSMSLTTEKKTLS